MNVNPLKYKTWLIDCDGVILDSNRLKTEVFYDVAIQYGHCNCSFVWSILEILDNAKYAYLVPPKDENALADAMVKLAKTPEQERQKLIEKARQRIRDEYGHNQVTKRLEKIYPTEYNAVVS